MHFTKQEQSGIFFLLLFIVLLQGGIYLYETFYNKPEQDRFVLNAKEQDVINHLKEERLNEKKEVIHPFNPNFISDYKGYVLGMSVIEIDRLHAYRKKDKYVNTALEFQNVTKISDSLLSKIEPYFKFPKWKSLKKPTALKLNKSNIVKSNQKKEYKDLNTVTAEELKVVNGIGEVFSKRIVKYRKKLGGFSSNEQIYNVYGLEVEVANRVLEKFQVIKPLNDKP